MKNPTLSSEQYTFRRKHGDTTLQLYLQVDHASQKLTISPDPVVEDALTESPERDRPRFRRKNPYGYFGFIGGRDHEKWAHILSMLMEANAFGAQRLIEGRRLNLVQFVQPDPI